MHSDLDLWINKIEPFGKEHLAEILDPLTGANPQVSGSVIAQRILGGQGDFWSEVYQPYSNKELTREAVIEVIEQMRRRGAASMPKLAKILVACDPDTEQKQFYRFKNFLYKMVRI